MILEWFNAEEAVKFAKETVKEINRLFPPEESKGKSFSAKEFQRKFDTMVLRSREFSIKNNLNIYQKARLLNTIKWEMKDAGHDDIIIDEFISFITPILNK